MKNLDPFSTTRWTEWIAIAVMALIMCLPIMQKRNIGLWDIGLLFGTASAIMSFLPLLLHLIQGGRKGIAKYLDHYQQSNGLPMKQLFWFLDLPLIIFGIYSAFQLLKIWKLSLI